MAFLITTAHGSWQYAVRLCLFSSLHFLWCNFRVQQLEARMSVHLSERDEAQMKIDCLETEINLLQQENSRLQDKLSVGLLEKKDSRLALIE